MDSRLALYVYNFQECFKDSMFAKIPLKYIETKADFYFYKYHHTLVEKIDNTGSRWEKKKPKNINYSITFYKKEKDLI